MTNKNQCFHCIFSSFSSSPFPTSHLLLRILPLNLRIQIESLAIESSITSSLLLCFIFSHAARAKNSAARHSTTVSSIIVARSVRCRHGVAGDDLQQPQSLLTEISWTYRIWTHRTFDWRVNTSLNDHWGDECHHHYDQYTSVKCPRGTFLYGILRHSLIVLRLSSFNSKRNSLELERAATSIYALRSKLRAPASSPTPMLTLSSDANSGTA